MQMYKDKYGFIVDVRESPHGVGDSCWQSSWLYFAYCVAGNANKLGNKSLWYYITRRLDGDPVGSVALFLRNFRRHCLKDDGLLTHPSGRANPFSRDQLSPLLLLLAAVKQCQPHLSGDAKAIIEHIVKLDEQGKPMSLAGPNANALVGRGALNDSLRYLVTKVADLYGVHYKKRKCSTYFSSTLALYQELWANQGKLTKVVEVADSVVGWFKKLTKQKHKTITVQHSLPRHYTIWNCAGLLTLVALIWHPHKDKDLKKWRKYFAWYAKNNWGVAYKIIAGHTYTNEDIEHYKDLKTNHINIVSQRGPVHLTAPALGDYQALDYPILRALELVWW